LQYIIKYRYYKDDPTAAHETIPVYSRTAIFFLPDVPNIIKIPLALRPVLQGIHETLNALTAIPSGFILVEQTDIWSVTLIHRLFKNAQMQGARGHEE
jgi:hypothetical protein